MWEDCRATLWEHLPVSEQDGTAGETWAYPSSALTAECALTFEMERKSWSAWGARPRSLPSAFCLLPSVTQCLFLPTTVGNEIFTSQ